MSRQEADIIKGLRAIAATAATLTPGIVERVDRETMTCEVRDPEGFVWYQVRLQAAIPAKSGCFLIPARESAVIIGRVDNADSYCVLLYSEIEEVCYRISGKYVLANEAENWFELFTTLLEDLSQATITTPAGPGNFAPQTVRAFTEVKTRFEKLFKKE